MGTDRYARAWSSSIEAPGTPACGRSAANTLASGIPAAHLAHPPRPIEGVWPEILLPLQANPKATAKPLFERLDRAYPGRFARAQMRTLQRRIREWRRVMACELVYRRLGKEGSGHEPVVLGVDTAASPENPRDASLTPQEIQ